MTNEIPKLWVVSNYPEGSGGHNAVNGVGRIFAARTGLQFQPIDAFQITEDFRATIRTVLEHLPDTVSPAGFPLYPRELLQRAFKDVVSEVFFRTHGVPRAMLLSIPRGSITSHPNSLSGMTRLEIPRSVFVADHLDIMVWNHYLPEHLSNLAPHSHTAESLAAEAARFKETLKGDGRPLIAVVLGQAYMSRENMAGLSAVANQFPNARFVVTTSPRTYKDMLPDLREFRSFLNEEQEKHFVFYDFHRDDKANNPYKALLTLADHMIIIGRSESMVSERLFAGRTVHYAYGADEGAPERVYSAELAGSGKIKYFPLKGPLTTEQFTPIDATSMIADSIFAIYEAKKVAEAPEPWPELEKLKGRMRQALPATLIS